MLATALTGGDDYEIVFTVKPEDRDALLASGADVTEIGRLTPEGVAGTVTVLDGTGRTDAPGGPGLDPLLEVVDETGSLAWAPSP